MRLAKIKISGFKSFVDPTTIAFPSNLVGVVGPNGCGKSNVIDATRWVMGEASAKYLRGDTKTDVIFNGSNARKPVGKASAELIFDNSDGSLGGEFANYSEIAIRRELTRDGNSQYYLNNTKCRRRDITDIFLGTGLGPRSYAIIEQGTISRMIEAKPEELRVYLEEAAGISKYKERRRETENRIRHTRENLERLTDVREELDKQLRRLNQQAKTAEKYKLFKIDEQKLKGELLTLRWHALDQQVGQQDDVLTQHDTQVEASMAALRKVEAEIEAEREVFTQRNDSLNKIQGQFYALGADIARLEQDIRYKQENLDRQTREREQLEYSLQEITGHLGRDSDEMSSLNTALAELVPALERAKQQEQSCKEALAAAEAEQGTWQGEWEALQTEISTLSQTTEVERMRIAGLDNNQQQVLQRRERLLAEAEQLEPETLEEQIAVSSEALELLNEQLTGGQERVVSLREQLQQARQDIQQQTQTLNQLRSNLRQTEGRKASLEALQQAALGQDVVSQNVKDWLTSHGLEQQPRLAQSITVEAGWETAVETVLGDFVEAVTLNDLSLATRANQQLDQPLQVVTEQPSADAMKGSLLAKVSGAKGAASLLSHVLVADDLASALDMLDSLAPNASVVTKDGIWLGVGWLRLNKQTGTAQATDSLLMRETALRECQEELASLEQQVTEAESAQSARQAELAATEQQHTEAQQSHNQNVRQQAQQESDTRRLQNQAQQIRQRQQNIQTEIADCDQRLAQDTDTVKAARQTLEAALETLATAEQRRQQLSTQRDAAQQRLNEARAAASAAVQNAHNLALQLETRKSSQHSKASNIERLNDQQQQLSERLATLQESLAEGDEPIVHMQELLERRLEERASEEASLTEARQLASQSENRQRELAGQRQQAEQAVQAARQGAENIRLQRQEIAVRRQTIVEQMTELDVDFKSVLQALPDDAEVQAWDEQLQSIQRKIERLGAINLAAIEEYEQQSERKEHLDAQNADLLEALETLENAIRKIDRETRTRFTDTFDRVNQGLGRIFPRMFGGGHAKLAKTDDDPLTTGVMIQAQPPGKRNSSISQLSGGEKALTAAALVFAIFELNPAPFCMLDEVDAPLDDANAGRLAEQIREMSKTVQFVFITHNKITMDLAEQLCGVTMREPGVSRLVAVDVDEAMKLAG